MSSAFSVLIQGALKRLSPDKELIVQRATSTGAAAGATLIDARLIDNTTDADSTKYVRTWARIPIQTTPAWSEECIREIGAYTPASGTLTPVDPFGFNYDGVGVTTANTTLTDTGRAWTTDEHVGNVVTCNGKTMTVTGNTGSVLTGASWSGGGNPGNAYPYGITRIVAADTQYEIHRLMPPSRLKECVNRTLRSLRRMVFTPFTQVTDGDMETAGVASWGTASNCAASKITTAGYVKHGSQSTRVLNSGLGGYLPSAAIPVIENHTWLVVGVGRCAVGTATLVPYDATNSAVIEDDAAIWTTDENAWFELGYLVTIPSGCESMVIRLSGSEATADIYWDSVIAFDVNEAILALPSWITDKNQVEGIFYFPRGVALDDGGYAVSQTAHQFLRDWATLIDETAIVPWQIEVPTPISRPLFLKALRPYAELSADTDTTVADYDKVIEGTIAFAKDLLGHADADKELQRFALRKQATEPRPEVIQRSPWVSRRAR